MRNISFWQFLKALALLWIGPAALFVAPAHGQTQIQSGPTNPTTCTVGAMFFNTTSAAMQTCSPANTWSSGSSSSGATGIPFVTTGLLADCPLTETSGTTVSCGSAGNATLGSGVNAPRFTNLSPFGTILGMDNFTNAALTTAGSWTQQQGTWSISGGVATFASGGGDGVAQASYTALPTATIYDSQFCQVTINTQPTGGNIAGCTVRSSPTAESFYYCAENGNTGNLLINKAVSGAISNLSLVAHTNAANDVLTLTAIENNGQTSLTLSCYSNGTLVTTATDAALSTGYTGIISASTGNVKNFVSGTLRQSPAAGGLVFGGGQFVTMPASLNSAITIEIFACYQRQSNLNVYNALIQGNGNGAASNANGIVLSGQGASNQPLVQNIPRVTTIAGSVGPGAVNVTQSFATLNGCGMVTESYGTALITAPDHVYLNGTEGAYAGLGQGAAAGLQTVGAYQLGGAATTSGFTSPTFLTGSIYRIRFFNRELTPNEVQQDSNAMAEYMAGRGVQPFLGDIYGQDMIVADGDSIINCGGITSAAQCWANGLTLYNPANSAGYYGTNTAYVQGITATGMSVLARTRSIQSDPLFSVRGNRNFLFIWACTNDLVLYGRTAAQCLTDMAAYSKGARALLAGVKIIPIDMISRTTGDTAKDQFNPLLRNYWATFADGFVDLGASTGIGADGQSVNATFFQDGTHPTSNSQLNIISPIIERAINRVYGNNDFTTATTYVAAALAATATTAGSEATNTVTITFGATPANCLAGNMVTIAGATPAGYNGTFMILTRTATQVTYFNATTGLGVISVQGTGVCPQQQDQDVYSILNFGAGNFTLETCVGMTGQNIAIKNINAVSSTIVPFGTETIDGAANLTIAQNAVAILQSQLTSNTAGGCSWRKIQNN